MKDYKKILEGVVDIINTTEKSDIGFANICTYICENCPELKESEDERIRRECISIIKAWERVCRKDGDLCEVAPACIAWLEKCKNNMSISEATKQELEDNLNKALEKETPESCNEFLEKQGEQKTAENKDYSAPLDIEIPFGAKDSELIQETIRIPDGCYAFIEGNEIVIKKGEKPAWSEEDEEMLIQVIEDIVKLAGPYVCYRKDIEWLKSLKDRYTWKPSNEQMGALANACDGKILNLDYLNSLYQDLKKLKKGE